MICETSGVFSPEQVAESIVCGVEQVSGGGGGVDGVRICRQKTLSCQARASWSFFGSSL